MTLAHKLELVLKVFDSYDTTDEIELFVFDWKSPIQVHVDAFDGTHLEKLRIDVARSYGIAQLVELPGERPFAGRDLEKSSTCGKLREDFQDLAMRPLMSDDLELFVGLHF